MPQKKQKNLVLPLTTIEKSDVFAKQATTDNLPLTSAMVVAVAVEGSPVNSPSYGPVGVVAPR